MWHIAERREGLPRLDARYACDSLSASAASFACPSMRKLTEPAHAAMSSAQLRLAETIDTFYGASDRTSESAMAAHAYRRSVEELDTGISRELVRCAPFSPPRHLGGIFFFHPQRSTAIGDS